jgi:hypothetical protein
MGKEVENSPQKHPLKKSTIGGFLCFIGYALAFVATA